MCLCIYGWQVPGIACKPFSDVIYTNANYDVSLTMQLCIGINCLFYNYKQKDFIACYSVSNKFTGHEVFAIFEFYSMNFNIYYNVYVYLTQLSTAP